MEGGSGREEGRSPVAAGGAGYGHGPPWVFRGSALYQLHLVKAATARAFVPKELRLVEAFGYTLGGMFLARYDDSPAGKFDELVVIAGIVWNPPTSCAWAARVLVNSAEACRHGRKEVGLPSHVATFSQIEAAALRDKPVVKSSSFLSLLGMCSVVSKHGNGHEVEISETKGSSTRHLCNISVPLTGLHRHKWMGPTIRMSLPSFSGQIEDHPDLLKYSCQVEGRVRPVRPAKIWRSRTPEPQECYDGKISSKHSGLLAEPDAQEQVVLVLLSKPILALEFNSLQMQVDAPKVVVPCSNKKEVRYSST
ncbi:protein NEOXANTHIN-DEFICIENT 1 isoform X2 [Oryza brachyantha]|uniref:Protein NEOXANTHIN-DEFICIENT 1 n=1 Tax=Oryza brachyantha TaxID=4533 RepID=J3LK63_ORYBR|nr:protein NEOXANTHIN-DEFICIENT 1 isoform X2 [Oryza brachyantha]XP_015691303.1 protein NEOXANTHIN-DEFICIENT 1 isoform X2 [Oryza brachyantha]